MDIEDAYKELEAHIEKADSLLRELNSEAGLSLQHLEWGEYAKTMIAVIDPHGSVLEESTPVGMFHDGWNIAKLYWSGYDEKEQKEVNIRGFALAVGALRAIVKTRPSPHPSKSEDLTSVAARIQSSIKHLQQQGKSPEDAEKQVAQNLATQAQNSPADKENLIKWGQSIGTATVTDVVKGAVKLAIRLAGIPIP